MYNVGPDFTRRGRRTSKAVCPECGKPCAPEWDGFEGEWTSSCCIEPMPDYEEPED